MDTPNLEHLEKVECPKHGMKYGYCYECLFFDNKVVKAPSVECIRCASYGYSQCICPEWQ